LIDIKPISNENWSTEATEYLKENLENTFVKVIPISKRNETYNVCIYLSNNTNLNVNMVLMKLAESTGNM
jgi:endonuclease YncB( thermonuclease family)